MTPIVFLGAYVIDLLVGDPHKFPHPVRLMGRFVAFLEDKIRKIDLYPNETTGGMVLWFAVIIHTYMITWALVKICFFAGSILGGVLVMLLASMTLATRSLYDESRSVLDALHMKDLTEARTRLSMIVGRDTEHLDEADILRAVVETVSENLSDGIIAPLFYLAVGGLPLAMTYKAVNTLDSMVGYKNENYRKFGHFSAKMDDLFNWIPARITGIIVVIASFLLKLRWRDSLRVMRRDGRKHASPNSGIPEAAMAGALGIRIGGTSKYFGKIVHKPAIGNGTKEIRRRDVKDAWAIMFVSSFLMALTCTMILFII